MEQNLLKLQAGRASSISIGSMDFMSRYWVKQSRRYCSELRSEDRLLSMKKVSWSKPWKIFLEMYDSRTYLAWCTGPFTDEAAPVVVVSMEWTAAVMSQWAARMRERRRDVKDLDASLT